MSKLSEEMKAIVAVSMTGSAAVVVRVWPDTLDSPWRHEFDAAGGSELVDDLGLNYPERAGLWVWEGRVYYCGPDSEGICEDVPEWRGQWRRATDVDAMKVLD